MKLSFLDIETTVKFMTIDGKMMIGRVIQVIRKSNADGGDVFGLIECKDLGGVIEVPEDYIYPSDAPDPGKEFDAEKSMELIRNSIDLLETFSTEMYNMFFTENGVKRKRQPEQLIVMRTWVASIQEIEYKFNLLKQQLAAEYSRSMGNEYVPKTVTREEAERFADNYMKSSFDDLFNKMRVKGEATVFYENELVVPRETFKMRRKRDEKLDPKTRGKK